MVPTIWFKRAGSPRIGETAGFGRPTNDMISLEARPSTLRHCGEPTTEKLISHFVDVMSRSIVRYVSYHVDIACLPWPIFTLGDHHCRRPAHSLIPSHFALSALLREGAHSPPPLFSLACRVARGRLCRRIDTECLGTARQARTRSRAHGKLQKDRDRQGEAIRVVGNIK